MTAFVQSAEVARSTFKPDNSKKKVGTTTFTFNSKTITELLRDTGNELATNFRRDVREVIILCS